MNNKFKLATSVLVIALLVNFNTVFAETKSDLEIKSQIIYPGSFYYPFKRVLEKVEEKLQFSGQSKISFYESLLKTRLTELNYVVEKRFLSEVQTSSERFAYQAGILSEELIKQSKVKDKERFIKEFEQYKKFLPNLRDKFEANSSFWMLVQHDINTLNILSDQLK